MKPSPPAPPKRSPPPTGAGGGIIIGSPVIPEPSPRDQLVQALMKQKARTQ